MPREKSPPLSINEAFELQPGDKNNPVWVNGLTGEVTAINPARAGAASIWKAILSNIGGGKRLAVTYWDEPRFAVGDTIEIEGTGARRIEFKGEQGVTLSKNNVTHVVHGGASTKPPVGRSFAQSDGRGGAPAEQESFENAAPAGQTRQQPARTPASAPASGNAFAVNGPRTGMCVELAVSIILHNAAHRQPKPVAGKETAVDAASRLVDLALLQHDVETIAAALMGACVRMEAGKVPLPDAGEDVNY